MAYFHLKLVAPRPTFPADMTDAEGEAMDKHFAYWRQKADERVAIVVGPVFDANGAYGMAVVETEDESAARALGDNDPMVTAGLGFGYAVASIPSAILRT